MTAHQLAQLLLSGPNIDIALVVNGHAYHSGYHNWTHGSLKTEVRESLREPAKQYVLIGNINEIDKPEKLNL